MGRRVGFAPGVVQRYLAVAGGAAITALGLELFLVPNAVLDGGVVGIAIIAAYLSGLPLGALLVAFNLPFLVFGYRQIGRSFSLSTLFAVLVLGAGVTAFQAFRPATDDLLLASVFGGVVVGAGVGFIIRHGGSLDGTEILAIVLSRRSAFSVGEIILFFNIFILGSAGFVFTWDRAMYSLIAYAVAFKVIDLVITGFEESKSAIIISGCPREIADAIMHRLGRGVTFLPGRGGYSDEAKEIIYCVITRLEVAKLKQIVAEKDPGAFVAIENVHDVMGGRFAKKPIH